VGERRLSARELNRAVLARQQLLERSRAPLPRVLERMATVQAQYAPSMYVGLWARMARFERATLTRALERRTVVQATLMRTTIHLVSRADYGPLAAATRAARRQAVLRVPHLAPPAEELQRLEAALAAALADGPLSRKEVEALIGKAGARAANGLFDLVRVPPSGTWERRSADLWASADWWLGPRADAPADPRDDLVHLIRRYLTGFGPATRHEIANWAGLRVTELDPALERLELRRFTAADDDAPLLDLPRLPLPDAGTPAPPRLLPTWDATLLTHARRAVILREEHRERIFSSRNPHSFPVFLVDGTVAGTWRADGDGRVTLEPFAPLEPADASAARAEADRLETWLAD
jgi:hypothetical protein